MIPSSPAALEFFATNLFTPAFGKNRSPRALPGEETLVSFFSHKQTSLLHCSIYLRIVDLHARKRAASISERRADGQEKGETGEEEKGSEKGQEKVVSPAG
jgi:hypothetical protein